MGQEKDVQLLDEDTDKRILSSPSNMTDRSDIELHVVLPRAANNGGDASDRHQSEPVSRGGGAALSQNLVAGIDSAGLQCQSTPPHSRTEASTSANQPADHVMPINPNTPNSKQTRTPTWWLLIDYCRSFRKPVLNGCFRALFSDCTSSRYSSSCCFRSSQGCFGGNCSSCSSPGCRFSYSAT